MATPIQHRRNLLRIITPQLIITRTRRQLSACLIVWTQLSQGLLAVDKGMRSVSRVFSIVMVNETVWMRPQSRLGSGSGPATMSEPKQSGDECKCCKYPDAYSDADEGAF
jgi:hypothetical protein